MIYRPGPLELTHGQPHKKRLDENDSLSRGFAKKSTKRRGSVKTCFSGIVVA
ncbi:hypothetical protein BDR03DRAFT_947300 [Suillus americanus]|nr:hypothetical protein BDR03DRAFT_947300 [Suillus americanus]